MRPLLLAFVAGAVVAAPNPAGATCIVVSRLQVVGAHCEVRTSVPPGTKLTFTAATGSCCYAMGHGGCSYPHPTPPGCVRLMRQTSRGSAPSRIPLRYHRGRATCGGFPTYELELALPEGSWMLHGLQRPASVTVTRPFRPAVPALEVAPSGEVTALGLGASSSRRLLAFVASPPKQPPVLHVRVLDGKLRVVGTSAVPLPAPAEGRLEVAAVDDGWLVGAGSMLVALDAAGQPRGGPRRVEGAGLRLAPRPGGALAAWYTPEPAALAEVVHADGRAAGSPQRLGKGVPGNALALPDGFVITLSYGNDVALLRLDRDGRVARRTAVEGSGATLLARPAGGVRVVAGNRVHDFDRKGEPLGAPRPFDEPLVGIELDAAGDDLVAAYVDAGALVLERLALDGRRGRTSLAGGAEIPLVATSGGGAPSARLVAFTRPGAKPTVVLVPAPIPPLGPPPPTGLGTGCPAP